MTMPKLNIGIITALALAGLATLVAIRHASQLKLREEIASLRRQAAQLPHLREEHQRLLNLVAQAASAQPPSAGPAFVRAHQLQDKLLIIVLNNQSQPAAIPLTAALDLWLPKSASYAI